MAEPDVAPAGPGRDDPPVRCLASRHVYVGPRLTVRVDDVEWAGGTRGIYTVVEKADFAVVLPREDAGFWLVQQYRYPTGRRSWEFPMGSWPPGHDGAGGPEALARTELAEETGLRAGRLERLGRLQVANGYSPSAFDVFLATELTPGDPAREVSESDMVHRYVSDADLGRMIRSGELTDSPSLAALMLYRATR